VAQFSPSGDFIVSRVYNPRVSVPALSATLRTWHPDSSLHVRIKMKVVWLATCSLSDYLICRVGDCILGTPWCFQSMYILYFSILWDHPLSWVFTASEITDIWQDVPVDLKLRQHGCSPMSYGSWVTLPKVCRLN